MGVYKKNNTWWIDFYYQGKRIRQKIGTKKKDAENALNHIKVKIAAGDYEAIGDRKREEDLTPQSILFKKFATEEFLPWSEASHSTRHYGNLKLILRKHLIPHFEGKHINEITRKHVEDYISKRSRSVFKRGRTERLIKNTSVNRDIACLKLFFKKAVEWNNISISPATDITALKEIPNPPRLLEEEEIARLTEEVPDRLKALVACALYAGLRRQELFQLRWEDVNMKTAELSVVSREAHHTKNYATRRIPMNNELLEAMRRHPRKLVTPYVFTNKEGKPYDNIRTALRGAAQRAEIEGGVNLHQLRHAFCSHALMRGIGARTVQKWMGHRDLSTTLRYAHVSPDHEKTAIQRLSYNHGHYMDTKKEQA